MIRVFKFFLSVNFVMEFLPYVYILATLAIISYKLMNSYVCNNPGKFLGLDSTSSKLHLVMLSLGVATFVEFLSYHYATSVFYSIHGFFGVISPFLLLAFAVYVGYFLRNNYSENGCLVSVAVFVIVFLTFVLTLTFFYRILFPHNNSVERRESSETEVIYLDSVLNMENNVAKVEAGTDTTSIR